MTREFLEEKGITDKEVINAILNEYHKGIKDYKDKAEKYETVEAENKNLKEQITERDKDLKELKKIDVKEMQNKIDELENKNKSMKEESDKQLLETKKNLLIENSLISSKAKNLKAIKGLLDMDKIGIRIKEEFLSFGQLRVVFHEPYDFHGVLGYAVIIQVWLGTFDRTFFNCIDFRDVNQFAQNFAADIVGKTGTGSGTAGKSKL